MKAFFVAKKNGDLRIVWDCRRANMAFRTPPPVDLGSADSLSHLEVGPHERIFVGAADVENCFYQVAIPPWLSNWFCLDEVRADVLIGLGILSDVNGVPLVGSERVQCFPWGSPGVSGWCNTCTKRLLTLRASAWIAGSRPHGRLRLSRRVPLLCRIVII